MEIPDRLLVELSLFASHHYLGKGLVSTPQMMGASCGDLASQWLDGHPTVPPLERDERVLVVSSCQRLGKVLGSYYLSEREV